MQLVQIGDVDPLIKQIFEDSKARWERVIVNDLPTFFNTAPNSVDLFSGVFPGNENFQPLVDDLVIGYEMAEFPPRDDGFITLGQAGPTWVRLIAGGPDPEYGNWPYFAAPIAGIMQFNRDVFTVGGPLNFSEADLRAIILHEVGIIATLVLTCFLFE